MDHSSENYQRMPAYVLLVLNETARTFGQQPTVETAALARRRLMQAKEFIRCLTETYVGEEGKLGLTCATDCHNLAMKAEALVYLLHGEARSELVDGLRGDLVKGAKNLLGNLNPFCLVWLTGLDIMLGVAE